MSAEDMMQGAYKQKTNENEVKVKSKIASTPGQQPTIEQTPVVPKVKPTTPITKEHKELPTGIAQVARDDVPVSHYGIKPVQVHFSTANRELRKWLTSFSSDNQFNGGVAITKSQFIEVMLDVMMYDLDINPIGYESHSELREDIQQKIKQLKG